MVNEPLESISADLGFAGNTLAEGMWAFLQLVLVVLVSLFTCYTQVVLALLLGAGLVVSICFGLLEEVLLGASSAAPSPTGLGDAVRSSSVHCL